LKGERCKARKEQKEKRKREKRIKVSREVMEEGGKIARERTGRGVKLGKNKGEEKKKKRERYPGKGWREERNIARGRIEGGEYKAREG
jgi:hypothetical protein